MTIVWRSSAVSRETISITLPDNLVEAMDRHRGGLPRSWWVEEAVRTHLGLPAKESDDKITLGLIDAEDALKVASKTLKNLRKKLKS